MDGQRTIGTTLEKTSSPTLSVTDLTKIGDVGFSAGEIDQTTLSSPNNFKEVMGGLLDAGDLPLEGYIHYRCNVSFT